MLQRVVVFMAARPTMVVQEDWACRASKCALEGQLEKAGLPADSSGRHQ
jgi:hypothetical protein